MIGKGIFYGTVAEFTAEAQEEELPLAVVIVGDTERLDATRVARILANIALTREAQIIGIPLDATVRAEVVRAVYGFETIGQ